MRAATAAAVAEAAAAETASVGSGGMLRCCRRVRHP